MTKGKRRVIVQDEETILLLWYKDEVFPIENRSNRSPVEGVCSEGLLNAKLTQVKVVVDEDLEGFVFSGKNEILNRKAAIIGFLFLVDFELFTGKGLLKRTGVLDECAISNALKLRRH